MADAVLNLELVGLGIIYYSPQHAAHIPPHSDYLEIAYTNAPDVQRHIQAGTIVGFATASPGTFILEIKQGPPPRGRVFQARYKLRQGLRCIGETVCFRDLYDLMDWDPQCPNGQSVAMEDGIYRVTLCSDLPASGVVGDDQRVEMYFERLPQFPQLATEGVPTLVHD